MGGLPGIIFKVCLITLSYTVITCKCFGQGERRAIKYMIKFGIVCLQKQNSPMKIPNTAVIAGRGLEGTVYVNKMIHFF